MSNIIVKIGKDIQKQCGLGYDEISLSRDLIANAVFRDNRGNEVATIKIGQKFYSITISGLDAAIASGQGTQGMANYAYATGVGMVTDSPLAAYAASKFNCAAYVIVTDTGIDSVAGGLAYDYVQLLIAQSKSIQLTRDMINKYGLDSTDIGNLIKQFGSHDIIYNIDGSVTANPAANFSGNGNTINFDLSYAGSIWGDTNNRLFGDALGYADGQLNGEGGKVQIMLTDMNLADGMDGLLKARADIINRYGDPEKYIITEKTGYANGISFADGFIIEKIKSGGGGEEKDLENPEDPENNNDPTPPDSNTDPADPNSPNDPSNPNNPNDPNSGTKKPWNPIDPTDPRNWPNYPDPNNPHYPSPNFLTQPGIPSSILPPMNKPYQFDPIVIDKDGDGIETVGLDAGIMFDHQADGTKNATGWVGKDDALLVVDRDGNGSIDSGRELFGDNTILANGQKAKDGYAALADLDTNHDNKIDVNDAAFSKLRLWQDINQDGISQANELQTLTDFGIKSIATQASITGAQNQANGNVIIGASTFEHEDGTVSGSGALNFAGDLFRREFTDVVDTTAVADLPDMRASGNVRDLREAAALSPELAAQLKDYAENPNTRSFAKLESLLQTWANTAEMDTIAATLKSGSHPIGGRGTNLSDSEIAKLDVLEKFTGYYATIPGFIDPMDIYDGKTDGRYTDTFYGINLDAGAINKSYELLINSVNDAIAWQTNMEPILNKITYKFSESGIKFDFSPLYQEINNDNATEKISEILNIYNHYARESTPLFSNDDYLYELTTFKDVLKQYNISVSANLALQVHQIISFEYMYYFETQEIQSAIFEIINAKNNFNLDAKQYLPKIYTSIFGNDNSENLIGSNYSDYIYGGKGDDYLSGGGGNDIYSYTTGDGIDVIMDDLGYSQLYINNTKLEDLIFAHQGDDLVIKFTSNQEDQIIVKNWYARVTNTNLSSIIIEGQELALDMLVLGVRIQKGSVWNDIIVGTSMQEEILGNLGNDTLIGEGGDDYLIGGGGNDVLYGNDGNDILFDESGGDLLYGGAGDDSLVHLNDGNSKLYGEDGNDILYADFGNNFISGGNGDDRIVFGRGNNTLLGGDGGDIIKVLTGSDIIHGNNLINGGRGNDILTGGNGNEQYLFNRGDGEDFIYEGGGNDKLTFGTGIKINDLQMIKNSDDLIIKIGSSDQITIVNWFVANINQIESLSFADGKTLNLANLKVGLENNDTLTGSELTDLLFGNVGNDTITANGGNDVLNGGTGNDTLAGGTGDDSYVYTIGDGQDIINETSGTDSLILNNISQENLIFNQQDNNLVITFKDNSNDQITVSNWFISTDNQLEKLLIGTTEYDLPHLVEEQLTIKSGTSGNDNLELINNQTTMIAGLGDDIIHDSTTHDTSYVYNRGDGKDTIIDGNSSGDVIKFGENITTSDLKYIKSGADLIISISDSEQITIKDSAWSQQRIETLQFSDGSSLNLAEQLQTSGILNPSKIVTSNNDDTLWLDNVASISLREGNNSLYLTNSENTVASSISAGAGNDTVIIEGSASNRVSLGSGNNSTTITGSTNSITTGTGNDTINVISTIKTTISAGNGDNSIYVKSNDAAAVTNITVGSGNDIIEVNQGTATIRDLGGNNDISYHGSGKVSITTGSGQDEISTTEAASATINSGAGNDKIIASQNNDIIYAKDGDDEIRGNAGNDKIYAGIGNDTIDGNSGDDLLYGEAGDDSYRYNRGDGNDTISDSRGSEQIIFGHSINPQDLTFTKSANDLIITIGNNLDNPENPDQITIKNHFHSSNNYQIETLQFSDGSQITTANLVQANGLNGGIANDTLTGTTENDKLLGNAGNDKLYGKDGNDLLNGGEGNDYLYGEAGNDTLSGGQGNDVLTGGAGDDNYRISAGDGKDIINDQEGKNSISFDNTVKKEDLWFSQKGQDLIITNTQTQDVVTVKKAYAWLTGDDPYAIIRSDTEVMESIMSGKELLKITHDMARLGATPMAQSEMTSSQQAEFSNIINSNWMVDASK